jgi:ABC-2 type transport system ATP-binding protein
MDIRVPQASMSAKLKVENLCKRYGAVQALNGVSFRIDGGEILGLLGPNGAGKTTAVESIAGLCQPDSGGIEVCGVDARRQPAEAKQRMGLALAATALQDKITPREAIESFGAFYRRRASTADLLARFDLGGMAGRFFETLSTGQKQRLALALAFVNQPELLILDEPSAGLDPEARRNMYASIQQLKEDGGAVLLTTHDMDDAERLCDRVVVIHLGRVVAEGSPAALTARSRTTTTISLRSLPAASPEVLSAIDGIAAIECAGTLARFLVTDVNRALAQLVPLLNAHNIEISELHAQKATLEEVVAGLM